MYSSITRQWKWRGSRIWVGTVLISFLKLFLVSIGKCLVIAYTLVTSDTVSPCPSPAVLTDRRNLRCHVWIWANVAATEDIICDCKCWYLIACVSCRLALYGLKDYGMFPSRMDFIASSIFASSHLLKMRVSGRVTLGDDALHQTSAPVFDISSLLLALHQHHYLFYLASGLHTSANILVTTSKENRENGTRHYQSSGTRPTISQKR